jgi:hypothetical protein
LNFLAHPRLFWLAAFLFAGVLMAAAIGGAFMIAAPDAATRHLCDQAVATLLHSKDPIELQRVDIIIRELSCAIARRTPELPRP